MPETKQRGNGTDRCTLLIHRHLEMAPHEVRVFLLFTNQKTRLRETTDLATATQLVGGRTRR